MGYKRVKALVERYLRGLIDAKTFWQAMNQLDRSGEIDENDWAYASSIVP